MIDEIIGDCGWFVVDCGRFWRNKGVGENREKHNGAGEDRREKKRNRNEENGKGRYFGSCEKKIIIIKKIY